MQRVAFLVLLIGLISCQPQPTLPPPSPHWVSINQGLSTHAPVLSISVDPAGTVYAATYDRVGVYKSYGGYDNWIPDNRGLAPVPAFALLSRQSRQWVGTAAGLYRRAIGSDSWEHDNALPAVAVYSLARLGESNLYAGTDANGIFASGDGGRNWTRLPGLDGEIVLSILALDARTILAGTSGQGLYVTRDQGASWEPVSGFQNSYVPWLVPDPEDAQIVYAGTRHAAMRSTDGGRTWRPIQGGIENEQVYSFLVSPEKRYILAGTASHGIFWSQDVGQTWQVVGTSRSVGELELAPIPQGHAVLTLFAAGTTLLAGTTDGVLHSNDGGLTWSPADYRQLSGIGTPGVHDLALDPGSGALFAATEDGLFLRRGADWKLYDGGAVDLPVLSFTFAPSNQRTIYAGTSHKGVFVSEDGAATWTAAGGDLGGRASVAGIVVDPGNAENVFARVLYERIYKSTDGGDNWHSVWTGMPTDTEIETVAIDSSDPTRMYAGGDKQSFFSGDSGETWTGGLLPGISTLALLIDPHNSQRLIAGTTDGLYISLDAGRNWTLNGLGGVTISALVRDRTGSIYIGTKGNGVYVTVDPDTSYEQLGAGLEHASVTALIVDDVHDIVYAATDDGVFCLPRGDRPGATAASLCS